MAKDDEAHPVCKQCDVGSQLQASSISLTNTRDTQKSNARKPRGARQNDWHWDGKEGPEKKITKTLVALLDERRLHLQGAVGLAAHGEQERDNDVESLERRGSGPGHRKQARLDPGVNAAHRDPTQVTESVRFRFCENSIRLPTQGREERYVPPIHDLHHITRMLSSAFAPLLRGHQKRKSEKSTTQA